MKFFKKLHESYKKKKEEKEMSTLKELEARADGFDKQFEQFIKGLRKNADETKQVLEMVRVLRKEIDGMKLDIAKLKSAASKDQGDALLNRAYESTVNTF